MNQHLLAPSILAADFTKLGEAIQLVNESEADWIHVDIMDGRFVPNISFGMMVTETVKSIAEKPLDVHLMIVEPEKYIETFRKAGADTITVHYEACPHLHRTVQQIKDTGARAGVALNPHTPVHLLEDLIEDIDMVLIMSVNPGFGGQKFIYHSIPKIQKLKDMITVRNTSTLIEVDGGVGLQNAEKLLQAGTDVLVAGSSVFRAKDPRQAITQLKGIEREPRHFV
ncbi:ribulose-phosphate 3-epimerase [Flavilitoribacter nigricans]|uniref:Ribulose-phosphate 3-epimerase n=1 Tax=Flavilitoribacter nigricans (strain ATCC 23147 / DSM 23189 / NBRC 102662 / NCIMB 1420 / SS-2) TaxID=1122177 RepID=A0A2D0NES1_FLAN2|nr:ribulose-phosphate 3-epimerase [Flavilitoribacter nigricans]PHN06856.1 ribulose-phosphate 3-epimerase [Flavilitoribacter nigricans DSM 23189 = NBRC 102662]